MMLKDTVSVIVPAYNREKYIKRCIDSILNQTYPKLQIIAVDDGSKDKTPQILNDYANQVTDHGLLDSTLETIREESEGVIETVADRGWLN